MADPVTPSTLDKMITLAVKAHRGQLDKGGMPYITHPLAVMGLMATDDIELLCIAVGHDLLEDTDVTVKMLREWGFTSRVVNGIVSLTKVDGESYGMYKAKVMMSPDAIKVKIADLTHNMDLSRLGRRPKPSDLKRHEKYAAFKMELLELTG
jgi:(p)ppGpp synthase/HD superfamily hydrolase